MGGMVTNPQSQLQNQQLQNQVTQQQVGLQNYYQNMVGQLMGGLGQGTTAYAMPLQNALAANLGSQVQGLAAGISPLQTAYQGQLANMALGPYQTQLESNANNYMTNALGTVLGTKIQAPQTYSGSTISTPLASSVASGAGGALGNKLVTGS